MERLVRSWKGHNKWILFKQKKNTEHEWFPKEEHIEMDSTFLSWKHSKGNVYGWMEHITIHIWNKGEKQMLNIIPHGSHKSELHLLLIPVKLYNVAQRCSSTLFPYFLSYRFFKHRLWPRLLYKWFMNTLNRLKWRNIDPQEKGVVLTAEELKYNHSK